MPSDKDSSMATRTKQAPSQTSETDVHDGPIYVWHYEWNLVDDKMCVAGCRDKVYWSYREPIGGSAVSVKRHEPGKAYPDTPIELGVSSSPGELERIASRDAASYGMLLINRGDPRAGQAMKRKYELTMQDSNGAETAHHINAWSEWFARAEAADTLPGEIVQVKYLGAAQPDTQQD